LEEQAIRRGLNELRWPGRFDVVSRRPLVILDCAHNELSIGALLETIAVELGPQVRPRLIFGCLEDKQWAQMAAMLAPRVRDVTLTRVEPKRPLEPENLLPLFAAQVPARVIREPRRAMEQLMAESGPDDVIVVTGSVYLVGEIYPYFLKRQGRRGLFPEAVM
jgi:dihydrofolate synthase/folylpolyglutamate synthase